MKTAATLLSAVADVRSTSRGNCYRVERQGGERPGEMLATEMGGSALGRESAPTAAASEASESFEKVGMVSVISEGLEP